jgi:predicted alpha/beta superfamily hydrolase
MKAKIKSWLLCGCVVVATCLSLVANAQIDSSVGVTIDSKILKQQRQIVISLPRNYSENTEVSYPVMYLLDGGHNLAHTSGSAQFLAANDMIPNVIIVGINNMDRFYDLTPTVSKDEQNKTGGGEKFIDFIDQELRPYINKHYRTVDYSMFTGHSLGGLLVVHALATRPELFDGYFSFSPSFWFDKEASLDLAIKALKQKQLDKFLYVSLANETGDMLSGFKRFEQALKQHQPEGFRYELEYMPNETHGTIPLHSQINAYRTFFNDWKMPREMFEQGVDAVTDFFAAKSKRYGYKILPSEGLLNSIGYFKLMQKEDAPAAIEFFELAVQYYPSSTNSYDSLAEGLRAQKKYQQALKMINKAIKLAGPEHASYQYYLKHKNTILDLLKS